MTVLLRNKHNCKVSTGNQNNGNGCKILMQKNMEIQFFFLFTTIVSNTYINWYINQYVFNDLEINIWSS